MKAVCRERQPGTSQSLWERFVLLEDWRRCTRMQTASNSGKKYMVTFEDDYLRSCAVYFMAHKSDTFAMCFMRRLPVRVENEYMC